MNWIGITSTFLTVVNILVCLLLIFVVLLQRPKTEGLGAAFGGDTASNLFGAQTSNVLANVTRWLGGLFLGLSLLIAILGTVDPTKKSAIADFVKQKDAEKKAEIERLKSEEAAKANAAGLTKPDGTSSEQPAGVSPGVEAITPGAAPVPGAAPTPGAAPSTPPLETPGATTPTPTPSSPAPGDATKTPAAPTPAGTIAPTPPTDKPSDAAPNAKPAETPATPAPTPAAPAEAPAPVPAPSAAPTPVQDAPKPQQ